MKAVNYYIIIDKIKEQPKSSSGFVLSESQNEFSFELIKYNGDELIIIVNSF